ncbi:Myb_DNA-bind_3 domain-containing protein [Cephalotus follicularis]|uniref:Myb_DNA-bind_3 domain-containing protein n=1 Tax=Cephalotus follicularis TaxID=3775 RepID=A0A1Q3B5A2_CEPFO|nr:Myb_DNA-bind_3 domain-containing protein [Cephalotus follicularis]
MACQAVISTRTSWTPTMERLFIDLMLEQLRRGNRLGHTFNKQAWNDMLITFNATFNTKCDRDILKSHYSMLWKQFNDIKNLLDQNGFSWDDHRKMVIADALVWDSYVKVHPDAQSYRNKPLVNWNDLYLIYAYPQADGRYSRSSHDLDLDDDIPGVNAEFSCNHLNQRGTKSTKSFGACSVTIASDERSRIDWIPSMDLYLIELMLEQIKKGNKINDTFSKRAWENMMTFFNAKFGSQYCKSFLRQRYRKLFKYYTDVRRLLDQKGFSWDGKQKMVVADDIIWEKYVKTHPDACSYRKKSLLDFQDLTTIFGNSGNSGLWGHIRQDNNFEDIIFEVKSGSDGLVTSWTPPMDSYLTDLLLDQALRGNKIGHEFIAQAWTEMVTTFNAKFGYEYHIDELKKHFKHLRKLYNEIKVLFEQSGFAWDDTQEMVTAADCVWDSYIKAYPNAESYRNKCVPSFHKLSIIYGQESNDGRNNDLAHNKALDNEGPAMMTGDNQFHTNSDSSRSDWTPPMDRHLIDLLLEQVHKGSRVDYALNNDVLIDMALSFMERFGVQYEKDLVRIHHKSLRKQYNDMKKLIDQGVFHWDEKRQMVTGYDDAWNAHIKEYPDLKSYRTEPKPYYNDLCLIFGYSTPDGSSHRSGQPISCNGGGEAKLINGNCLSTQWTPLMDRYLIDQMLEQVRQGSMFDQNLNKHAWDDMVAKFSAEFGSHRDKDVLKSHIKNLRQLFNDMKNLLDQNGFTWDEMQQMIIADSNLWDAYIKKHPDARSYRNRILPSFNDLFLVYGNTNNDYKDYYSSNLCDEDAENYALGINIGYEDDQHPQSSDPLRIRWTMPMDCYLIDLMLEQERRGNKIGHTFNNQAWAWMISSFNDKFRLLFDKGVLENRYISLMKKHDSVTNHLNQNGLAWNEYSVQRFSFVDVKMEMGNIDSVFGDLLSPAREFEISSQTRKRKSATKSTSAAYSRKVQRPFEDEMQEAFDERPGFGKTLGNNAENEDHNCIETVVDALQAIPDMDDVLFLEACKLLVDDKIVEMFLAMDVNRRRKWLLKRLHR